MSPWWLDGHSHKVSLTIKIETIQEIAQQYLLNLKNQKFEAAMELTSDQLKSQTAPERLKTDLKVV
jgi:hypothetical protein